MFKTQNYTRMSGMDQFLWDFLFGEDLFCIWGISTLKEPLKEDIVELALKYLIKTIPILNVTPKLSFLKGSWQFLDKYDVTDLIVQIKTDTDAEANDRLKNVFTYPIKVNKASMIRLISIDGPTKHYFIIQVHHLVVDGEGLKRVCVKFAEIYRALLNDLNWKPPTMLNPSRSWLQIAKQFKINYWGLVVKSYYLKLHETIRLILLKRMKYNLIGDYEVTISDTLTTPFFEGITIEKEIMLKLKAFTKSKKFTVNDVLMASFSLAIKEWNLNRGDNREWLKFLYTANMRRWWGEPDGTFGNYSAILIFEEMNKNVTDPMTTLTTVNKKMKRVKRTIGLDSFVLLTQLKFIPLYFIRKFSLWMKPKVSKLLQYNHAMTNIGIVFEEAGDFGHTQALNYSLLAPTYQGGCIIFTISTYKNETTIYIGCNEDYLKKDSAKQFLKLWKKKILETIQYNH